MEENKIINKTEAEVAEEKLKNFKIFLEEIVNKGEARELINNYLQTRDIQAKENIKNYVIEKYNLDTNIFNKYITALQEKQKEYIQKDKQLQQIQENLMQEATKLNKALSNNITLKILLPFLLAKDIAMQFNIQSSLLIAELKKEINKVLQDRFTEKSSKMYLQNLLSVLNNKNLTEREKIEELKEDTKAGLLILNKLNKKDTEQIILKAKEIQNNIKNKIITKTAEKQIMLLEHKVTNKNLNIVEKNNIEHLALHTAILLNSNNTNLYKQCMFVKDASKLNLNVNLTYNLFKQVFDNVNKKEFAELYLYAANNKVTENINLKNIKEFAKNNKTELNNVNKQLYNINITDINFKNKIKEIEIM